jgi:hypothetical protein
MVLLGLNRDRLCRAIMDQIKVYLAQAVQQEKREYDD